jgi:glycosyltransferase involved in cell wall biosynthesis
MRIAFITYEYPPFFIGGAGVYADNITTELAKNGHEVTVFTPDIEHSCPAPNTTNLKIVRIKLKDIVPFKLVQFWLKLPKVISAIEKGQKFDVLHINGFSYPFLQKRISKTPQIITIHHLPSDAAENNDLGLIERIKDVRGESNFIYPFIEKRAFTAVDRIIAVSNFTRERLLKKYGIDATKIQVIQNGTVLYQQSIDRGRTAASSISETLAQKKPIILFVGRVNDPRKGLDLLLNALKLVIMEMPATLVIVGGGDQTKPRHLVESLGLSDNTFFMGYVDEQKLIELYMLCDVFVCPSTLEGFGITVIEAMSFNKPVIATAVGALPELINDGVNGFLVKPNDPYALAKAIGTTIKDNPGNIKTDSNASYVRDTYSWTNAARKTEELYKSLADRA